MIRVLMAALCLIALALISLFIGPRDIAFDSFAAALQAYDQYDAEHVTLMQIRLPRLWAALIAGGALGVAAMVMQVVTRNPFADPGVLGINAGAAFFLIVGTTLLGRADEAFVAVFAFPGAALMALIVFALGGGFLRDINPIRLVLAGVAVNALLASLLTALVLLRQDSLDVMRFWVAGSLSQATTRPLFEMSLIALAGASLAMALATRFEAFALGGDMSQGLGVRPGRVLAGALIVVTLCAGAAVSVAGPIAFLGLIVPPIVRVLSPGDLRLGLLMSAVIGALILLFADVLGRVILSPLEVRAGIMTALLGTPLFLWVARRMSPGQVS
ncbi:MAG: iron ABC transporter permease [Pseudomonadota bacterium]